MQTFSRETDKAEKDGEVVEGGGGGLDMVERMEKANLKATRRIE